MPEAKITTDFGDIRITYTNMDDLSEALHGLEEQTKTISQTVKKITPASPRLSKPGYERAYRFLPTGRVELLIFPQALVQLAVLALFAYFPDSVSTGELEQVTGIDDIGAKALGQTKNKKYFRKVDDAYSLSPDGIAFFIEKVKPMIDAGLNDGQLPEDGEK